MGSIIEAECECGFKSRAIPAGGGMLNFDKTCKVPALCKRCQELVVVNYLNEKLKCPKCRRKVAAYNDPTLQDSSHKEEGMNEIFSWNVEGEKGAFVLPNTNYLCPKCGQIRMRFMEIGCWD